LRRLFAERVRLVVGALAIIPVLAALGYRGGEAYLAVGKPAAPSGLRIRRRVLSWDVVGPIVAVLLVAATAAFASSLARPNPRTVVAGSPVASDRLAGALVSMCGVSEGRPSEITTTRAAASQPGKQNVQQ
jgi:hypothetical protein